MELGENVKNQPTHQREENPNPPQPFNINTQIDEGLATSRTLVNELRGMREPNRESLVTSLDIIVRSIANSQGKLNSISQHTNRMYEFYHTRLTSNQFRDLGI